MNNHGSIGVITMLVFEVLFVIVLVGMMTKGSIDMAESESVKKINSAEDLRLIVESLLSVPGDGIIESSIPSTGLTLSLTSSGVQVYKKGESEYVWIERTISFPEGYVAYGSEVSPGSVCIEKKQKTLLLRLCNVKETKYYPKFNTLLSTKQGDLYSYDAGEGATILYFRYVNSKWQWSPDNLNWMYVNTTKVEGGEWDGKKPVKENILLIEYLNNYNPSPNPSAEINS